MKATKSVPTFFIQPRPVHVWSELRHALAFSLTGTGGALYFYLAFTGIFKTTAATGIALLALALVSAGALIIFSLELTYRDVFVRYFLSNVGQSWISRGVLALFVFGIASITALLVGTLDESFQALERGLTVVAALAGLFVIVYPSLVLSTAAIPFWRSALLPVEFLVTGGLGGLAVIVLCQIMGNARISLGPPVIALGSLLLLNLVLHVVHIATMPASTRRETIELLTAGELKTPFVAGFFVLGVGVPLILVLGSYFVDGLSRPPILFVTAVLVLLGIFFQRYSVLRAGIKPALL